MWRSSECVIIREGVLAVCQNVRALLVADEVNALPGVIPALQTLAVQAPRPSHLSGTVTLIALEHLAGGRPAMAGFALRN